MLDLALELGMPLEALHRLSERELRLWQRFAMRKAFPQRRLEFYLANIAMLIATTMGGVEDVTLKDFLFDPKNESHSEEMTDAELATLKEEIGFSPVD